MGENTINITNDKNRLTPEEIQKRVADAEEFAQEDQRVRERVEAKTSLESYGYTLKRQLETKDETLAQKISDKDRAAIIQVIEDKLEWLMDNEDNASVEEILEAKKAIEEVAQPIIAKLYEQGGSSSHDDL